MWSLVVDDDAGAHAHAGHGDIGSSMIEALEEALERSPLEGIDARRRALVVGRDGRRALARGDADDGRSEPLGDRDERLADPTSVGDLVGRPIAGGLGRERVRALLRPRGLLLSDRRTRDDGAADQGQDHEERLRDVHRLLLVSRAGARER
jgi:hypothetical protein